MALSLPQDSFSLLRKLLCWGLVILFAVLLYRTAWLSDDAYISFRSVDNFVNGYGLRWNVADRVQTFTNPLWTLAHIPIYALSREMYFTPIYFSMFISLLTVALFAWRIPLVSGRPQALGWVAFGLLVMVLSKSFMDYSTSGLENPLTHLLILAFVLTYLKRDEGERRLFTLALISGLALWNRMDTLLFFLPGLALAFWPVRSRRTIWLLVLGLAPFLLWELFAVIYYGFPFPNTAYAKLNTGVGTTASLGMGFAYFKNSLLSDPVSLVSILLSFVLVIRLGWARLRHLLLGVALYLVYILWIGGDFMSGRFFSGPLFMSLVVLAYAAPNLKSLGNIGPKLKTGLQLSGIGIWLVLGLGMTEFPSLFSNSQYGLSGEKIIDDAGIADERAFYYPGTGLLMAKPGKVMPDFRWAVRARESVPKSPRVKVAANMGFLGFFGGPNLHLVDRLGITDPLLARMPAIYDPDPRPGHYYRYMPIGYSHSSLRGPQYEGPFYDNPFEDKLLGAYWEKLCKVTRGDLFSWERLKLIFGFNFGRYKKEVDRNFYRYPLKEELTVPELRRLKQGLELERGKGAWVKLENLGASTQLDLHLDLEGTYILAFLKNGKVISGKQLNGVDLYDREFFVKEVDLAAWDALDATGLMIFPVSNWLGSWRLVNVVFN